MKDYTATSTKFVHDLFESLYKSKLGHKRPETFARDENGYYKNHIVAQHFYWFLAGMDAASNFVPARPTGDKPDFILP